MTDRVTVGNLGVAKVLYDFINAEALPGTDIDPDSFWAGVDKVVTDLSPQNQDLLARNIERISEVGSASLFDDDVSPDDRKSAVELLKVPISSLRTREDFLGWAKAHIIFND